MRKKITALFLKVLISGIFLFLVVKRIDFKFILTTFRNSNLFLLFSGLTIWFITSLFLALRWFQIISVYKNRLSFPLVWKLTMVGLFFNIFLPTSAGGDAIKIFYLVRGKEEKFTPAISVIIDRFIGSFSVLIMGAIALFFSDVKEHGVKIFIFSISTLLFLLFLFFSFRNFALKIYNPIGKILPSFLDKKLRFLYQQLYFYFSNHKKILVATGISFFLQFLSIYANYLVACALSENLNLSLNIFFIYIPLIWVATTIPSIGGLGIREFSYVFFFKNYLGEEKAFALSLFFLFSLLIQAFAGYIIFLFLREDYVKSSQNQPQKQ